jgi:3'-phosphoadenosine 5'-phosphosulfate sulfotransferase (PAPS reductase)/FAD synthetase
MWVATGIRITDGPQRAIALTKNPNPNLKLHKLYPIAEWRKAEVWSHIKRQGLPISRAYNLIGRSLDCLNVAHVYPLKFGSPKDYERIVADFPLMDCLCWLYEKRVERYGLASIGEC